MNNKDNAREATMSEYLRMCGELNCKVCPLSAINDTDEDCAGYCLAHPEAANKAVIEWCEAHPDMRWISIEERHPRFCESVIVAGSNGSVWRDEYMSDGFLFEKIYGNVTHWMSMPKAPGGAEKQNAKELYDGLWRNIISRDKSEPGDKRVGGVI